jgi:hypothetical protein
LDLMLGHRAKVSAAAVIAVVVAVAVDVVVVVVIFVVVVVVIVIVVVIVVVVVASCCCCCCDKYVRFQFTPVLMYTIFNTTTHVIGTFFFSLQCLFVLCVFLSGCLK